MNLDSANATTMNGDYSRSGRYPTTAKDTNEPTPRDTPKYSKERNVRFA